MRCGALHLGFFMASGSRTAVLAAISGNALLTVLKFGAAFVGHSASMMNEAIHSLVDEPSIGLEPRFIEMVFEILDDLQNTEGKTIIMVEQNARKGLEFADIGYVLVSGEIAIAGTGNELLNNPEVGKLPLGG